MVYHKLSTCTTVVRSGRTPTTTWCRAFSWTAAMCRLRPSTRATRASSCARVCAGCGRRSGAGRAPCRRTPASRASSAVAPTSTCCCVAATSHTSTSSVTVPGTSSHRCRSTSTTGDATAYLLLHTCRG